MSKHGDHRSLPNLLMMLSRHYDLDRPYRIFNPIPKFLRWLPGARSWCIIVTRAPKREKPLTPREANERYAIQRLRPIGCICDPGEGEDWICARCNGHRP